MPSSLKSSNTTFGSRYCSPRIGIGIASPEYHVFGWIRIRNWKSNPIPSGIAARPAHLPQHRAGPLRIRWNRPHLPIPLRLSLSGSLLPAAAAPSPICQCRPSVDGYALLPPRRIVLYRHLRRPSSSSSTSSYAHPSPQWSRRPSSSKSLAGPPSPSSSHLRWVVLCLLFTMPGG